MGLDTGLPVNGASRFGSSWNGCLGYSCHCTLTNGSAVLNQFVAKPCPMIFWQSAGLIGGDAFMAEIKPKTAKDKITTILKRNEVVMRQRRDFYIAWHIYQLEDD